MFAAWRANVRRDPLAAEALGSRYSKRGVRSKRYVA
jgi:hypothetical protein